MSIAGAIDQLLKIDDHELAAMVIQFDRERRERAKLKTGQQLHLSNATSHKVNQEILTIRRTGEIREVIQKILKKYQPGRQLSSFEILRELEKFHIETNFFTKKDLSDDSEGKPLWKKRASNALKGMVKDGLIIKVSAKMYQVEVW